MAFKKGHTPWNKDRRVKDLCVVCGNEFYPTDNKWHQRRKTCSEKCRKELFSRGMRGRESWNKGKTMSKEHRRKLSIAAKLAWKSGKHKNNPTSGGSPAWNSGKVMTQTMGSKNPNWKGGITPLMVQIRRCRKYKQWTKTILKRDDYTCQLCGVRGAEFNVDHKKRFSIIVEENKIDNLQKALACSELWELSNGRTLCVACHKQVTFKGGGMGAS